MKNLNKLNKITNKRQRKVIAFFDSIIHSLPIGVFTIYAEMNILKWNLKCESLFGYLQEEIVGINFNAIILDAVEIKKKLDKEKFIDNFRTSIISKSGEIIKCEISITPLVGKQVESYNKPIQYCVYINVNIKK